MKSWSRQQNAIALSSGEAELYVAVRVVQELLGIRALAHDMGISLECNLQIDAKATVGMIRRKGAGRNRHIEVRHYWIQDVIRKGLISLERVQSYYNVADILTKYVAPHVMERHLKRMRIAVTNWTG